MSENIRIAITPGEPAGVGPELTLKLAQQSLNYEIVAIANKQMMQHQAKELGLHVKFEPFNTQEKTNIHQPGRLKIIDIDLPQPTEFGKLNSANSKYVIETLNIAVNLVQTRSLHALCTAPVQKSIINDANIAFSGHTEFIADITGGHPVMLLTNESINKNTSLRVALVTTHLPIKKLLVPSPEKELRKC